MFKVMDRRCDQCLYGDRKIVSNTRKRQLIKETVGNDHHFLCHKATIVGEEVCCRGDWDAHGGGQMGRIAGRLGAIQFVSAEEYETKAKSAADDGMPVREVS